MLRRLRLVDFKSFADEAIELAPLTLLVGAYAQRWHLGGPARPVTAAVRDWRDFPPGVLPLPHPSWRNTGWLKKNPWFEEEVLPWLRSHVRRLVG